MKKCKESNCSFPAFSGGFCKRHQYLRADRSNKAHQLNFKPLSRRKRYISPIKKNNCLKTPKQLLKESFGFSSQKEMFDWIWETRPHICELTDANLDKVPKSKRHWCFAHILAKGSYSYWKFNPENIWLLNPDIHGLVDNFTEDLREKHDVDFDKWFNKQDEMKEKYKVFCDIHML